MIWNLQNQVRSKTNVAHVIEWCSACGASDCRSLPLEDHWSRCLENFDNTTWTIIQKIDTDIRFSNILSSVISSLYHRSRHGIQHNDDCKLTAIFRRSANVSRRPPYTGNDESWRWNHCGWETLCNVPSEEGHFIPSRRCLFGFSKYNSMLNMLSSWLYTITCIAWQIKTYTHWKWHQCINWIFL